MSRAVEELCAVQSAPSSHRDKTRHGRVPPPVPRGRTPGGLSPKDRMRRKLQTKRGRQRYALRMETVEPVFGQIKHVRGFRQFLLRGLAKVNREWLLICTGHNLLKLFRFGRRVPGRGWLARVPMVQPLHRQHHVPPGRITHRLTQHPARSAANPQTCCQAMWIVQSPPERFRRWSGCLFFPCCRELY